MSSKSILDLMPAEQAKKAVERGKKRLDRNRDRKGIDISPEIYLTSEMGYYFGWDAVMAIRRGYTVVPGTNEKEVFTLDEAMVLLEGARKVWYAKNVEMAHGNLVANSSVHSKNPGEAFNKGVKPFTDRADIKE